MLWERPRRVISRLQYISLSVDSDTKGRPIWRVECQILFELSDEMGKTDNPQESVDFRSRI